jgi:hypothetical protein
MVFIQQLMSVRVAATSLVVLIFTTMWIFPFIIPNDLTTQNHEVEDVEFEELSVDPDEFKD